MHALDRPVSNVCIAVMDSHPPKDTRIGRHIQFLLKNDIQVLHLNYNFYDTRSAKSGRFSDFGEIGMRLDLFDRFHVHSGLQRVISNASYLLGDEMARDATLALESLNAESPPSIIHVHDPILLPLASRLVKGPFKRAKLVYDRHELYEASQSFHGINVATIFERIARKQISGVAVVSEQHIPATARRFPGAKIAAVPNYPSIRDYNHEAIERKLESFDSTSQINITYIGSLDNAFDRDLDLMLRIAKTTLESRENVRFIFGGRADPVLEARLKALAAQFPGRFEFPGYIPRERTVALTEQAHLGFYLMNPNTCYWVKCSPNKIFEYLICGVVPVIRADVDHADEIAKCSLLFDRDSSEDEIIESVLNLIDDPARVSEMMRRAREISARFTFEGVAKKYLELYGLSRD